MLCHAPAGGATVPRATAIDLVVVNLRELAVGTAQSAVVDAAATAQEHYSDGAAPVDERRRRLVEVVGELGREADGVRVVGEPAHHRFGRQQVAAGMPSVFGIRPPASDFMPMTETFFCWQTGTTSF